MDTSYGSLMGQAHPIPPAYPMGGKVDPSAPVAPTIPGAPYGTPAPSPTPAPAPQSQQMPQNIQSMAMLGQAPVGAAPEIPAPQPAYPKQGGIGPNGFGLHPDVTQDEIIDYLMPKFESVESSGDPKNYVGKNKHLPYKAGDSSATGLYQYTESTWNNYKGYPRAMDAPIEIQKEKMRSDLKAALARYGNDPYKAIAHHYQPSLAHDPTQWDNPIVDRHGKVLMYKSGRRPQTVTEYAHAILQAGNDPAGERFEKYLKGVNPHR